MIARPWPNGRGWTVGIPGVGEADIWDKDPAAGRDFMQVNIYRKGNPYACKTFACPVDVVDPVYAARLGLAQGKPVTI